MDAALRSEADDAVHLPGLSSGRAGKRTSGVTLRESRRDSVEHFDFDSHHKSSLCVLEFVKVGLCQKGDMSFPQRGECQLYCIFKTFTTVLKGFLLHF